jgi:hypothetical protein
MVEVAAVSRIVHNSRDPSRLSVATNGMCGQGCGLILMMGEGSRDGGAGVSNVAEADVDEKEDDEAVVASTNGAVMEDAVANACASARTVDEARRKLAEERDGTIVAVG